jgi:hypothetical protein
VSSKGLSRLVANPGIAILSVIVDVDLNVDRTATSTSTTAVKVKAHVEVNPARAPNVEARLPTLLSVTSADPLNSRRCTSFAVSMRFEEPRVHPLRSSRSGVAPHACSVSASRSLVEDLDQRSSVRSAAKKLLR